MRSQNQRIVRVAWAFLAAHACAQAAWQDPSEHKVQFVEVEPGVRLEVLDWGGSGRPVLLLAGNGNTAHVFDALAVKLAATYHVYGLTRRGFGTKARIQRRQAPLARTPSIVAFVRSCCSGAMLSTLRARHSAASRSRKRVD